MKYLIVLFLSFSIWGNESACRCSDNPKLDENKIEKLKLWIAPGFTLNASKEGSMAGISAMAGGAYYFNGVVGITSGVSFMQRGALDQQRELKATYLDIPLGFTFVNAGSLATNRFTLFNIGAFYSIPLSGSSMGIPNVPTEFTPDSSFGFFLDGILSFPIPGDITYGLYSSVKFSFSDMLSVADNTILRANNATNYSFGLAIVF